MKKFLTYVITPFLSILLILIKVPDIEDWLKETHTYSGLYIGIGIAVSTVIIHIINVVSPFKKYEKIEKNKWTMIDLIIDSFQENFFSKNKLSANVMVAKRCFLNKREPYKNESKKLSRHYFQKVFEVIWSYNNRPIDKRLVFTVRQGVSGMANSYGKPVLKDMKNDGNEDLNLNADQKKALEDLEFIISCPIFAVDEHYGKISNKIIGILNVSCSHKDSRFLIEDSDSRINLTAKVVDFSNICSLIM